MQRTPFYDFHVSHGGKMVDYAGWEMPLHYGSIMDEHRQVRRGGGLFDVSHMGRLRFKGRDAVRFLDRVCTRQIAGMQDGQVRYGLICNDQGGCMDDVLVYRVSETEYLVVCNAANRATLLGHFENVRGELVFKLKDQTQSTAMIAVQGPAVMDIIANLSSEIPSLKRYRFTTKNLFIASFMVSRTGYTGEDGVEIILPASFASRAIDMLLKRVDQDDAAVQPVGLGARDSLRLEAGMPLYGHEITADIDPLSAGLAFAVKLDKGEGECEVEPFIGQEALRAIAETGPRHRLVGLLLDGRRSPRQDMPVLVNNEVIGRVTSGCLSPTLDQPIAMAYVPAEFDGDGVQVDLGRAIAASTIVPLPFYKRP